MSDSDGMWPVPAWEPPGGEPAARRSPASSLMVGEWQRSARERLLAALGDVFGDVGAGVPMLLPGPADATCPLLAVP